MRKKHPRKAADVAQETTILASQRSDGINILCVGLLGTRPPYVR